jgi:probable phosphoglycerate mutase
METIIYLVRHGQTEWNIDRKIQGRLDSPLTALGIKQAKELAKKLELLAIDHIYTSSSNRAIQTATHLRGNRNIPFVKTDALMEISLGKWEGKKWSDIEKDFPDELQLMNDHPESYTARETEGETFFQAQDRLITFVNKIRHKHVGKSVLLVSHALAIKVIINYFRGGTMETLWEGPDAHWASLYQLRFSDTGVQILFEEKLVAQCSKFTNKN